MLHNLFEKFKLLKSNWLYRLSFTIINFIKYRSNLKQVLLYDQLAIEGNIDFSIPHLVNLKPSLLKSWNIQALILDFDGVLAHYGENQPVVEVINWLETALELFGAGKIFILSNNPALPRKIFLDQYFDKKIIFVTSNPKPDPAGIIYINKYLSDNLGRVLPKEQILLFDDRIATGILAAKIFGISSCLILDPYVNMKKNFLVEFLLIMLRKLERLMVWHL